MPVETLRPSDGRLGGGVPFTSAMPFRILTKGPGYFRRPAEPGARRLSAVERLEADKAKYVKSQQVALTRQAPVRPPGRTPIIRRPLLSPGMQRQMAMPPARKERGGGGGGARRGPPTLNLDVLNNLINDVGDAPASRSPDPSSSFSFSSSSSSSSSSPSPSASSPSSGAKSLGSSLSAERHRTGGGGGGGAPLLLLPSSSPSCDPHHRPLPPPVPARAPRPAPHPAAVRRVDVRPPPAAPGKLPPREAAPASGASAPAPAPKPLRPRQTSRPQAPPSRPQAPPSLPPRPPAPPQAPPRGPTLPPASPAFTRLSGGASSRGSSRRPLHRSKSDLSDRYARATADLERFFNYCGLDPQEVEGLGGRERFAQRAASDIVSNVAKLRSVSTPSSECGGEEGGEEEGEGEEEGRGGAEERVPYGISVIERNARVIKWLYGLRQARDAGQAVSNV